MNPGNPFNPPTQAGPATNTTNAWTPEQIQALRERLPAPQPPETGGLTNDQYMRLGSACFDTDCTFVDVVDMVSRLIREARIEVLEGAAQMLDGVADENRDGGNDYDAGTYDAAAREVRAFAAVVGKVEGVEP